MGAPSAPSHQSPGNGSLTVSSCPQRPSSFAVPLTGSPVIAIKQVQSKPCQGASSLSLPAELQLGGAPSSMGPTWTLSGLQARQLLAVTFTWRSHQPFLVHLLLLRELVAGEPSLN